MQGVIRFLHAKGNLSTKKSQETYFIYGKDFIKRKSCRPVMKMRNLGLPKVLTISKAPAIPNCPCVRPFFLSFIDGVHLGQPILCARSRPDHFVCVTYLLFIKKKQIIPKVCSWELPLACGNLITPRASYFDHC